VDLSRRLKDYYSPSKLKKTNNYICNALICYTHSAFSLTILEYIDITHLNIEDIRKLILEQEQHFLDSLEPEYNIQKIAGNFLGQKRSEKTKALISVVKSDVIFLLKLKQKLVLPLKGKHILLKLKLK
jgi:group I intron endonuclease